LKLLLETIKTIFTKNQGLGPDKIVQTFGLNVADLIVMGLKVKMWDMGGKKDFRSMWKEYYKSCHALIYVVDASDPDVERLEESKREFDELTRDKDLVGVPFMIIANYKSIPSSVPSSPVTPLPDTPLTMITHVEGLQEARAPLVGTEREQQTFRRIFIDTLDQGNGFADCIYFVKTVSALTGAGVQDSVQLLVKYLKDHARHINDEDFI
jgi:ADP-ribosylation factor related protein 1